MLAPEPEGQGKEGERERRIAPESLLIRDYGDDAAAAAATSAVPFATPDITPPPRPPVPRAAFSAMFRRYILYKCDTYTYLRERRTRSNKLKRFFP